MSGWGLRNLRIKDLTGLVVGKITVLALSEEVEYGKTYWICKCECGVICRKERRNILSGKSNSCGCLTRRTGNTNPGWKGYGEIPAHFFTQIKVSASGNKGKNRTRIVIPKTFTITIEDIWNLFLIQERKCALTGIPLQFGSPKANIETTASLDRIDSSKGYELNNVQWVHKDINYMKNNYDQNYFIEMCKLVANNC